MSNRHSYQSVARFFPAMQAVIEASTNSNVSIIEVNPASLNLAPSTCAARLRDAIQAVSMGLVTTPFDRQAFLDAAKEWVVTSTLDKVRIVHAKRRHEQHQAEIAQKLEVSLTTFKPAFELDKQDLAALCHLLSRRVLTGEYIVRVPSDVDWTHIKASYDISVVDNNDNTYTLL